MGGSDDPSNIIEVSIEEHANLHLDLYLQYGDYKDWIACQGLSGQMNGYEIQMEFSRMGGYMTSAKLTHEQRVALDIRQIQRK